MHKITQNDNVCHNKLDSLNMRLILASTRTHHDFVIIDYSKFMSIIVIGTLINENTRWVESMGLRKTQKSEGRLAPREIEKTRGRPSLTGSGR